MANELIYTSVPHGLNAGSSGFCTAATTQSLPRQMAMKLEGISSYEFHFQLSDPQAHLNPANFAHTRVTLGSDTHSVLSRIAFSGGDHTNRTNKIAHHFLLDPAEMGPEGPAWMLLQMASGTFRTDYKDPPQSFPPRDLRAIALAPRPGGPARHWQQRTGDAGWAGALAKAFRDNPKVPAFVIFSPGTDLLPLFEEALAVLPTEERWSVGFATYYSVLPPGVQYHWRGVVAGSPACGEIARFPNAMVIDLTKPMPRAAMNEFTEAARAGRCVRSAAAAAPTIQSAAAAATGGVMPSIPGGQAPLRVREPYALDAAAAMEGIPVDLPAGGDRPILIRRRSKAVPILIAAVVLLLLANVGTALFFKMRQAQATKDADVAKAAAQTSAADSAKADLLAKHAARWQKEAEAAAESAKTAKQAASRAKDKPDEAAREVRNAEEHARRAALAADAVADLAGLLPKEVPASEPAVARVNAAKGPAEKARSDAQAAADEAKKALAGPATPAAPDTAAANKEAEAALAKKVQDAAEKVKTAAKQARDALGKANAAKDADKATAARDAAQTAMKEAEQAAKKANDAADALGKRSGDDLKNAALAKLAGDILSVATEAKEKAEEARLDAEAAARAPWLQPKVAIETRTTEGITKTERVTGNRNGSVLEFKVPGADRMMKWSELSKSVTLTLTTPEGKPGTTVLNASGPSGDLLFMTFRFDGTGTLNCEFGPRAADLLKDLSQWFVLEVKNSTSGTVYQCMLDRPEPVKYTFKTGFEVKDGKLIRIVEPKPLTFSHPWPDTLSIFDATGSRLKGLPGVKDAPKVVPLIWKDGPDPKQKIRLNLTITPPARKDDVYRVAADMPFMESIQKAAESAAANLPAFEATRDELDKSRKRITETLKKNNDTITELSGQFKMPPGDFKSPEDYKNDLKAQIKKLEEQIAPYLGKIKEANDRIRDINQQLEAAKKERDDKAKEARKPHEQVPKNSPRKPAADATIAQVNKSLDEEIKRLDARADELRKPHEEAKKNAEGPLKDPSEDLGRANRMLTAIDEVERATAALAKSNSDLKTNKESIEALQKEPREMMQALAEALKNGPIEIRDAWDLPIVTMDLQFKECNPGEMIRALKP